MNTTYVDKLAKEIIESLAFSIDNKIGELKVKIYLKAKLKEFQQDINKSMLVENADAFFEVLCRFPFNGVSIEDFCAGVIYKDKLLNAEHHFLEIKTIGETRILELFDEIEKIQKLKEVEEKNLYSDQEYLDLIQARRCFKSNSNSKKLIEIELYKKERKFISLYNKQKEFKNILSNACMGKSYGELSSDEIKNFEKKLSKIVSTIRQKNQTSNM